MISIFYFVIPIFGAWLVISVFAQFSKKRWMLWLRYNDIFALIPLWTFFAPNPGVTDTRLLYRDRLVDAQYSPWIEVKFSNNSVLNAFWHPEKRRKKVVMDTCSLLLETMRSIKDKSFLLTMPYLVVLNFIMTMPKNQLGEQRQFMITSTFGYNSAKEPEILFISQLHRI